MTMLPNEIYERFLNDLQICKILRCCHFFSDAITPVRLAELSGLPIEVTADHLNTLIQYKILSLIGEKPEQKWQLNLDTKILSEAFARAEMSYIKAHSMIRVNLEGRLEWMADAYEMIQHAKRSLHEAVPKS